jgi:hypothetical protein
MESGFGQVVGDSVVAELNLLSITVYDQNMQPISGYQYSDDSDALYPFDGGIYVGPTPEPASGLLAATGVLAMIGLLRRCRGSSFSGS